MATEFYELNNLETLKSQDYETYFGAMDLTKAQKERRIKIAEQLEDGFMFVLSLISVWNNFSAVDWDYIQSQFENAYNRVLDENSDMQDYVSNMSYNLTESTKNNLGSEYSLSYDRARYIAENEVNAIDGHEEYVEAVKSGKTRKTWRTMIDGKVRHTHAVLEGKAIPIYGFFEVGDSLMRYPKDELGSAEQTVNCRCCLKFS